VQLDRDVPAVGADANALGDAVGVDATPSPSSAAAAAYVAITAWEIWALAAAEWIDSLGVSRGASAMR
jgi:hypothetical protein